MLTHILSDRSIKRPVRTKKVRKMKNEKPPRIIRLRKLPSLVDVLSTRPDMRHGEQNRGRCAI